MCSSHEARQGGFVRPAGVGEGQAPRASFAKGREFLRRPWRRSKLPAPITVKQMGHVTNARPRVRTRGVTDDLRRPRHCDPETRRTKTSSPFEGRRQAPTFRQPRDRRAKPGAAQFRFGRELDAQRFRENTKKAANGRKDALALD